MNNLIIEGALEDALLRAVDRLAYGYLPEQIENSVTNGMGYDFEGYRIWAITNKVVDTGKMPDWLRNSVDGLKIALTAMELRNPGDSSHDEEDTVKALMDERCRAVSMIRPGSFDNIH